MFSENRHKQNQCVWHIFPKMMVVAAAKKCDVIGHINKVRLIFRILLEGQSRQSFLRHIPRCASGTASQLHRRSSVFAAQVSRGDRFKNRRKPTGLADVNDHAIPLPVANFNGQNAMTTGASSSCAKSRAICSITFKSHTTLTSWRNSSCTTPA